MRRSSSTSRLPVARARSSSRGGKDERNSGIPQLKRSLSSASISKKALHTPVMPSTSGSKVGTSSKATSYLTPLGSSQRTRARSPFSKSDRKKLVNDKEWVRSQFMKIVEYCERAGAEDSILNNLEPFSINSFVYVIGSLLKELNPWTDVNMKNYKAVLPTILKTYGYPDVIPPSLLKTVNVGHSWRQVVGLLSWFIDFVNAMKPKPFHSEDNVKQMNMLKFRAICQHYVRFNSEADPRSAEEEYVEGVEKILNVDKTVHEDLRKEVNQLRELVRRQADKIGALTEQLQPLQTLIDAGDDNKLMFQEKMEEVDDVLVQLNKRAVDLEEWIKSASEKHEELKETLSKQSCTKDEKFAVEESIEDLKETLVLKRRIIESLKVEVSESAKEFNAMKHEIRRDIYEHQETFIRVGKADCRLKRLNLKTEDPTDKINLVKEISEQIQMMNTFIREFGNEIDQNKECAKQYLARIRLLQEEKAHKEKDVANLKEIAVKYEQEISGIRDEIKMTVENRIAQLREIARKMSDLKSSSADIEIMQEYKRMRKARFNKNKEFAEYCASTVDFLKQLYDVFTQNAGEMIEIRNNVVELLRKNMETVLELQKETLNDLHKVDDISAKSTKPK